VLDRHQAPLATPCTKHDAIRGRGIVH
jgi:hypothetical protein